MSSIKFKFRSSLKFDSVDIGDRSSISVGELKSKIQRQMKLSISSDSHLVLSDAVSGQEYKDENFQIHSGSSVIIKRVPAGSASFTIKSINTVEDPAVKATEQNEVPLRASKDNDLSKLPFRGKKEVIDFDDFGEDLCYVPKEMPSGPVCKVEKEVCGINKKPDLEPDTLRDIVRHNEHTIEECHKLDQSDLSEDVLADNLMQAGSGLKVEEHVKLGKMVDVDPCAVQNVDLPSDIKCPLCYSVYKDAVMIPCCQHSFCEKCIRSMLIQKGKCPKCLSAKCRPEDLLPNLSLRQAIEHFLESQSFNGGTENAYRQYAPDGESGIQVKEVCDEVTILQRVDEFAQSSSATGQGSNHIVVESTQHKRLGKKDLTGDNGSHINLQYKANQVHRGHGSSNHDEFTGSHEMAVSDFQGENQPVMEQGDSSIKKKKGLRIGTSGGDVKIMETGRFRKGDRACYMCGSFDHLIRDCPVASSQDPMIPRGKLAFPGAMPGYMSPLWNGNRLPYVRPFPEQYPYPGTWPFGAANIPSPAFHVPMYMPPTYGGLPHYGSFMTSGSVAPHYGSRGGQEPNHQEFKDIENREKNPRIGYEKFPRETSFGDQDNDDFGRKHHYEEKADGAYHMGKETSGSYSNESFDPKYLRIHQHQNHPHSDEHLLDERHEKTRRQSISDRNGGSHHHQQKLCLEVEEDKPTRSSSHQQSKEWHYHHHGDPKKDKERRDKCDSDSSRSKNDGKRKREKSSVERKTENYHHLEHDLDHTHPAEPERKRKNQNHSQSRHSRHSSRNEENSIGKELIHDRWNMESGSIEYKGGTHHRPRQKMQ